MLDSEASDSGAVGKIPSLEDTDFDLEFTELQTDIEAELTKRQWTHYAESFLPLSTLEIETHDSDTHDSEGPGANQTPDVLSLTNACLGTTCYAFKTNALDANALDANALDANALDANALDANALDADNYVFHDWPTESCMADGGLRLVHVPVDDRHHFIQAARVMVGTCPDTCRPFVTCATAQTGRTIPRAVLRHHPRVCRLAYRPLPNKPQKRELKTTCVLKTNACKDTTRKH
ncbi:hypothetical protein GNI_132600 [Gregarina niphandrodes]|uniref:Uncharacterized protein n=1 Tax=Gregarina niphandrodes TaxID=110365 RepID=A0A023B1A1_GRENI|nr:hypothetical protein GNI_132600 [Gregarina niphandrodes]EZG46953.1 hypothetical protein GNI_132600 [Gregarina niphandrodes]|eukprot:XP_011132228.1 hypothetical protein GNI_132600 [Gregarina niphandrodes]